MERLTCQSEIRTIEKYVIEEIGIPSLVLMEKAAKGICETIVDQWRSKQGKKSAKVLILAGTGNNGADGLALARMLSLLPEEDARGKFQVTVLSSQEKHTKSQEYQIQEKWIKYYNVENITTLPLSDYDIYVDAVFGFGLNREVAGEYAEWIQWVNGKEGMKVAIDLPSGIHTDSGQVLGNAFQADVTVTFSYRKPGQILYPGSTYCGRTIVKSLDFPQGVEQKVLGDTKYVTLKPGDVRLPIRKRDGHKGTFGKVLVVGGYENMPGAAIMSAKAALHSGCGMIRVCSQRQNRDIILSMVPEAQFSSVEELEGILDWPDVIVIGPGLGTSQEAGKSLEMVLKSQYAKRVICDADALNLLAEECNEMWEFIDCKKDREVILTPHMGELSRLLQMPVKELKNPQEEYSLDFAKKHQVYMVKKDARTMVICDNRPIYMNSTGNSGMGTGGSGDVLTGILAGLLAQNKENTYNTVCLSVCLHGMAGDLAATKSNEYSVSAGNIIEEIDSVVQVLSECTISEESNGNNY